MPGPVFAVAWSQSSLTEAYSTACVTAAKKILKRSVCICEYIRTYIHRGDKDKKGEDRCDGKKKSTRYVRFIFIYRMVPGTR